MAKTTKKQTLAQAVALVRTSRGLHDVTRCGLGGCPIGGWPETEQAIGRIEEALPLRSERSYTVDNIIGALYEIDHAGRYRYRIDEEEA